MTKKREAFEKSQNPSGPVDKPKGKKQPPGISDDTRVVYSEEHNLEDG